MEMEVEGGGGGGKRVYDKIDFFKKKYKIFWDQLDSNKWREGLRINSPL